MPWPTPADYNEAVQRPRAFLEDEELRSGEAVRSPLGLPMLWSGNFADVYQIRCPATGNTWALKCFTRHVQGLQQRYRSIAACLEQAKLPFTVDFQYLEHGVRIGGGWYPALKMRWVEGIALNQFVEEHLQRPQNLQMLLDLWVKLAARLREAGVAHADLQHGNVLLVPMEGGSLALRLIDYDGMYVPALAGSRSGELGHPAYQHPQRLRECTYNAEVDRFSHLVIYTAVRCLMVGRGDLWRRFNTGENLLFRDADFRRPAASELFHALWEIGNADAEALVGRLALACRRPLEETPLVQDLIAPDGKVLPLSASETCEVEVALSAEAGPAWEKSAAEPLAARAPEWLSDTPTAMDGLHASATGGTGGQPADAIAPPEGRDRQSPGATVLRPDRFQPAPAGRPSARRRSLLRVVAAVLIVSLLGVMGRMGFLPFARQPFSPEGSAPAEVPKPLQLPPTAPQTVDPGKPSDVAVIRPLHLQPIESQTIGVGKQLAFGVLVKDARQWQGRVRFSLGPGAPPGAIVDAESGAFTWTPSLEQAAGKFNVTILASSPEVGKDETSFAVNVVRPTPPLRLQPIHPQIVEAGKPLAVVVAVEDAPRWQGKLRYSLGPQSPPGASVAPQSGEFSWTPPADHASGEHEVTVSVQGPEGHTTQTSFVVTVTRPSPPPEKEISVDLGDGIMLEMVLIPAGEFLMGSPDSDKHARADEKPQHRVRITKPFYLGKYLVTREQWQAGWGNNMSNFNGPKVPVRGVTWEYFRNFVERLNTKLGGGEFSLPTEAQWEYACRAGSTTRYFFGDDGAQLRDYAWRDETRGARRSEPHPVGEKKPNAWGLYDIYGSVGEWCADWYDARYYVSSPLNDPTGPTSGSGHVCRGGRHRGAGDDGSAGRTSFPSGSLPADVGLRVARVAVEPAAESQPPSPRSLLKLQPVAPQTVEPGKPLSMALTVVNADTWHGKLRYSLGADAPPGAKIDPATGTFTWTPADGPGPSRYEVAVSVEGPDGQGGQTALAITVARPNPRGLKEATLDLGPGVGLELVLIPAGSFTMGGPTETPVHRVNITHPFYLGKYPVTQEQWEAVLGNNPSRFKGPNNPVESVSWNDCQGFLEKLNAKPRPGGGIFRLPTEAEWEYACRAETTTKYCFGDDERQLGDYAWYRNNSGDNTHPVGEKEPNAWGLYDMHGNVCESCADWYDGGYYVGSPTDDPTGPLRGSVRVYRGGGWRDFPRLCRSAYRGGRTPDVRIDSMGFRLARVPAE